MGDASNGYEAIAEEWSDAMTGKRSESLGAEAYRRLLETAGLVLEGEADDEGANHYYMVFKP